MKANETSILNHISSAEGDPVDLRQPGRRLGRGIRPVARHYERNARRALRLQHNEPWHSTNERPAVDQPPQVNRQEWWMD